MSRYMKCWVFIVIVLMTGCQSASKQSDGQKLTESEALTLAVDLANKQCDANYSFAPFDVSSYVIEFRRGRWHWGSFDLAGESGFSAVVSFGPRGEDQHIEIFLSTDVISPLREDNDQRE